MVTYVTPEEMMDTVTAMCLQETRGYQALDYLSEVTRHSHYRGPLHVAPVDVSCRSAMVKWCNTLTDFCAYDSATTSIAMSCVDRFMSTEDGFELLFDRNDFQLAVMAAYYTAAKIHEKRALEPESVSRLSRGKHSADDIEKMESRMLAALQWRVNPPTAQSFSKIFLDMIPSDRMDACVRPVIEELIGYQLNLALMDYELSICKDSLVAAAALLNALDSQSGNESFVSFVQSQLISFLADNHDNADMHSEEKMQCLLQSARYHLYELVASQPATEQAKVALCPKSSLLERTVQTNQHMDLEPSIKGTSLSITIPDDQRNEGCETESPRAVSYGFS